MPVATSNLIELNDADLRLASFSLIRLAQSEWASPALRSWFVSQAAQLAEEGDRRKLVLLELDDGIGRSLLSIIDTPPEDEPPCAA